MLVDFHCHSNWSDGSSSVRDIIERGKKRNIKHLSITDHDTMGGCSDAIFLGKKMGINVYTGIEVSCKDYIHDKKVHLLGYGFDMENEALLEYSHWMVKTRNQNASSIIEKISYLGYNIKLEDFKDRLEEGKPIYKQNIMDFLLRDEVSENIYGPLFKSFQSEGIFKEKIPYITYKEGLTLLKKTCPLVAIAHIDIYDNWEILDELVIDGLNGIEVDHFQHTDEGKKRALEAALHYDLLVTGGSDFHGDFKNPKKGATDIGVEMDEKWVNLFVEKVRDNDLTNAVYRKI